MRNIFTIFKKSAILTGALCIMLIAVACSTEGNAEPIATGQASLPTVATSSENATTNEQDEQIEETQATENDYQALIDFLSEMTTIFTGVPREDIEWTDEGTILTGRFWLGWDSEAGQPITTYELPEIYLSGVGAARFYDALGNPIEDAPWMYVQRYNEWTSYYYAGYFKLYDFGNGEMPDVFIHFNQTFDGGYAGFYRIFRYIDGEYKMLDMKAFENGVESRRLWIGSSHLLFQDNEGRFITFLSSEYHGIFSYEHLVLTDESAELHLILELDFDGWEEWHEHHWVDWSDGMGTDSWLQNSPTIFGTDIPLTLVEPLLELQESITATIMQNLNIQ